MAKSNRTQHSSEAFVPHEEDPMLSYSEAGRLVGRTGQTIKNWVTDGYVRAFRDPSGSHRVRKSELIAFYNNSAMGITRPLTGEAI